MTDWDNFLEALASTLELHDVRRWARFNKADGSLDYLRCPCGFQTQEDSNNAMFRHVASVLRDKLAPLLEAGERLRRKDDDWCERDNAWDAAREAALKESKP